MTTVLCFLASAILSYGLCCLNGALMISRLVYREDVREKGSGNAGLTNFIRIYGTKSAVAVVLVDVLKTVAAVLLSEWLFGRFVGDVRLGAYWAGFWATIGHSYPCTEGFRGGKGVLCGGTLLVLLDWRIAVIGLGLFALTVLLTRYVSLGSLLATLSYPITTAVFFFAEPHAVWLIVFSSAVALSIFWSHRMNIVRLFRGTESKFSLRRKEESHET